MSETKNKVTKYKDFLFLVLKGQLEEVKIDFNVRKARKSLESFILNIEEEISDAEGKIDDMKTKFPIDYTSLLNAMDEIALHTRRLNQANDLLKELF